MKICTKCNLPKSAKKFSKRGNTLYSWCRECVTELSMARKERLAIENTKKLVAYLLNNPCVECNETDPIVLDFDHVTGKKEENVSRMVSMGWSWEAIEKEISKCQVRCSNCHRRKSAKQFNHLRVRIVDEMCAHNSTAECPPD